MNGELTKNGGYRRIIVCIWAYLCAYSFGKIIALHGNANVYYGWKYFGFNIGAVVVFGVTVWLLNAFWKNTDKRMKQFSVIGGLLLSFAIVYGAYTHYLNNIFGDLTQNLQQILMVLSILAFTMPFTGKVLSWLNCAERWFEKEQSRNEARDTKLRKAWNKVTYFFRMHHKMFFLAMWLTIFLSYLPLFLGWWPGNFIWDAPFQMINVIDGYYPTHHPLIHTLMMGAAYKLGQAVGDVSWGFQFYTLAQMLILSSSFAYTLLYLYKKKVKPVFLVAVWMFFAIFPMHAIFSITATKDVLCAAFFLFFMIFLIRWLWDREKLKTVSYVGMIGSGMLFSLFRNNAFYAVVAMFVLLVIFVKGWKEKRKTALIFMAVVILTKAADSGLIALTNGVDTDSARESMSMPLQGLARVAYYRYGDLDEELYNEICNYIPEENLPLYNPYCSDQIKNEANEKLLRENSLNFWKLWLKVGIQFPDEYIESILANTMGYWYPLNQGHYITQDLALYHMMIGKGDEIVKQSYCDWASEMYSALFWKTEYHYVPLLGYAFRNAPYFWMIVFYMLWGLYKKSREKILLGLLPFLYLGTCLLGPLAAIRYIYCIVVCVPLIAYLTLSNKQKEIET